MNPIKSLDHLVIITCWIAIQTLVGFMAVTNLTSPVEVVVIEGLLSISLFYSIVVSIGLNVLIEQLIKFYSMPIYKSFKTHLIARHNT